MSWRGWLIGLALFAGAARAEDLVSPWDRVAVTQTDAPYACPAPPQFAKMIRIQSYYTDPHMSVIDPTKLAEFQKASKATTDLTLDVSLAADAYRKSGSRAAGRCVYTLLDAAAKAEAWDGHMPTFQGVYVQNWTLSGVAMAYLKVRSSGLGTAEQSAAIKAWFGNLAARVREYFDAHKGEPGSDAWNNHMNWAGLAVGAEAVADNDRQAADWALDAYERGISLIRADGTLPAEMNRAGMALHYHLYALGALVMMAELVEANGGEAYADQGGAIHRLVRFCTRGLEDPGVLEGMTGVKQVVSEPLSGTDIGWAVPYLRRFPNAELAALLARAAWKRASVWGGEPPE